ncbi:E3 ubiquitin-protein ligase ZNF598-like, partial [Anneissia japonica]|uniref:E3 ubiquitin-protein ligase ZNF598-like n=1 Tax=Anneissia japonica TaxID=1529436 RepID=UPI00142587C0
NYENLREHFRQMHYLCEEGACIDEEFTAAFRSKIDLKAHKASKHMSKKEAKQARQLDWEFNYASHRSTHRDGVVTGADYNETHGSYRGRGRGFRNQSNREHDDTARALEASLQTEQRDTAKEKRPPKRRDKPRGDKPRGEKTENLQKVNVKPDEEKQTPFIKEDEFEKRRAASKVAVVTVPAVAVATATALAAVPSKQKKEYKPESNFDNQKNTSSDWSVGTELTSCQFTESTWKNEKDISKLSNDLQSKSEDKVEQKSVKNMSSVRIESTPMQTKKIDQSLSESDFPSLGKVVTSSGSSWGKVVPDANEFPALGSSANLRKLVPTPIDGSASSKVSQKSELHVDFSKAIAANAILHDKKKKALQLHPQPPPPPTQSYEDFPTLSSIAEILKGAPESNQSWTIHKQASAEVKSTKTSSKNPIMMHSQATSQQKEKIKEKPVKERNKQTTNSNPEKEKKFNSNGVHITDQSTSAKAARSKPSKERNKQTTNSNPEQEKKFNSSNGLHTKDQSTSAKAVIPKPSKEKNKQTTNSNPEKEKKFNSSNGLHTKDLSTSAMAEQSKPPYMDNPSVICTKTEKISKSEDDSKASDIDSDSTTRMPPGFPLQTPKRYPPGLSLPTTIPPPGFDKGSTFNPPPRFSVASVFVEPSNFKQRNMDLIYKIQTHLNYDVDGFNEFKRLSGQFRQGNLSGKDYYE